MFSCKGNALHDSSRTIHICNFCGWRPLELCGLKSAWSYVAAVDMAVLLQEQNLITQRKNTKVTVYSLSIKKNYDKTNTERQKNCTESTIFVVYRERAIGKQRRELLTVLERIKGDFTEEMTLHLGLEG